METTTPQRSRLLAAFAAAQDKLYASRETAGHWTGQLSASALSTATAITALSFYLKTGHPDAALRETISYQIPAGLEWLRQQQNPDGGWGDTDKSYSNISTTMLVVAALRAAEKTSDFATAIASAEEFIQARGGIDGLRKRYGRDKTFSVPILACCAMAGYVEWREVSALPFEAACVPQRFYHLLQLPVVSYAIPALVAIGQVKFVHDPPRNPLTRVIRRLSLHRSRRVLANMQPASGGFLEAVPLTSFVAMGLIKAGTPGHPVVENGIRFIVESYRSENDSVRTTGGNLGSWPIDTNLATWNTTLAINGLANGPQRLTPLRDNSPSQFDRLIQWLLDCQYRERHPFTGSPPGGWGWSNLSGAVPDADDTPGALLALKHFHEAVEDSELRGRIFRAAENGVAWLLQLQNRDGGWPTFCRGWGRLPFDRSGMDITAHVLRGLLAWQPLLTVSSNPPRIQRAIDRGFEYLRTGQQTDGSWLPLWFGNQDVVEEENPCYGTAKVLMAFRDANLLDTQAARSGLRWLVANQGLDGGWGGGPSISWNQSQLGHSSVEETALSVEILLADRPGSAAWQAGWRGVEWLLKCQESENLGVSSPIGFYFAKLWYHEKLYPLIFATAAFATACARSGNGSNAAGEQLELTNHRTQVRMD